jgi:hypothetical protein
MKSRFLNVSPRAYARQKDSVNVIPPVVRTGYQNEIGEESSPFSENDNTIVFENNRSILAPYMIPADRASESGFLTGTLFLTSSIRDGSSYQDKKIQYNPVFPFKEGSNPAAYSKRDDPGFPSELFPGFASPDSDKTALVFDLSTTSDFDVIKLNSGDSNRDPSGPFYGRSGSGFLYYNHKTKSWEDVGTRDPSTGSPVAYDPIFQLDENLALPFAGTPVYKIVSGTNTYLGQFTGSPYSLVSEDPLYRPSNDAALEARGYHRIGEPTSFFEAPYAPRYHSPTGSSLKLSDYITAPFVVDRISVNFPVTAFRTQDPRSGVGATDFGFGRDIDNYVFFVYVQNRSNATPDSEQDVSSSIRYLVGKESFCFFNRNTLDAVRPGQPLLHNVSQFYSFDLPFRTASMPGVSVKKSINAKIDMTFRPLTFNSVFGTTSKLAGSAFRAGTGSVTGSVFIQNFWRGGQVASGTSVAPFVPSGFRNLNVIPGAFSPTVQFQNCKPSPRSLVSSFWEGSPASITSGSGLGNLAGTEISTVSDFSTSKMTPIILFPDDELVFGIDSGANSNMQSPGTGRSDEGIDTSVLAITGSRVTIRAGNAQVVLYGSLISNKVEQLPVLNQHLGSSAVQEDIHESGPFDQFDIYDRSILSASYVDNVFSGDIFAGERERVSFATKGEAWITGSLQRNIKLISSDFLYYDTFVPPISVIADGLDNSLVSVSFLTKEPALQINKDGTRGYPVENIREGNSLFSRPFTYEKENSQARQRDFIVSLLNPSASIYLGAGRGDVSRFFMYYNGATNPAVDDPAAVQKNYKGAASIRYGMISPRIIGPGSVYRRDRYGQFRDLLEQGRNTKYVITSTGKDVVGEAAINAMFVSASADTVVSPSETQSSNLSFECTSSRPYADDGIVHNRGPLPASFAKFGPNNLVFGITGSFGFNN